MFPCVPLYLVEPCQIWWSFSYNTVFYMTSTSKGHNIWIILVNVSVYICNKNTCVYSCATVFAHVHCVFCKNFRLDRTHKNTHDVNSNLRWGKANSVHVNIQTIVLHSSLLMLRKIHYYFSLENTSAVRNYLNSSLLSC